MKKRLFIVSEFPPPFGGIGSYVQGLMNSDLRNEFSLELFRTNRFSKKVKTQGYGFGKLNEVSSGVLFRAGVVTLWHMFCFPFKLIMFNPDKVYINSAGDLCFFENSWYLLISKLFGKKVLFHMHNGAFIDFYKESNFLLQAYIKFILNKANAFVVSTKSWEKKYKKIGVKQVHTSPNFIQLKDYQVKKKKNKVPVVLFLGYFSKNKGVYDLLKAIKKVKKGAKFVFYGDGDRKGLQNIIRKEKLNASVHGPVYGTKKKNVFASADLFVLPSHKEGFGIVLLEAMASGVPIVASQTGGIPDLVKKGHGFLFKPKNVDDLAKKIDLGLKGNKGMIKKNLKLVKDYTLESTVKKLLKILRSVD